MVPTFVSPDLDSDAATPCIAARYLMLQGSTPVYVDEHGRKWLDRLWAIDAREHLSHIQQLSIACPFVPIAEARTQTVPVDGDSSLARITFLPLPWAASRARALRQLPSMCSALWRAIRTNDVVHMGVAGWPYPLGWLGWPLARLLRKTSIVVVESAPWRGDITSASRWLRMHGRIYEWLGRGIVRRADLRFFTTEQYRSSLGASDTAREHVIEATWIPQDQVIVDSALADLLAARALEAQRTLRIGFFGRMTTDKGIHVLAEAMRTVDPRINVSLDLYGDGPELAALGKTLATSAPIRVKLCGTLAYGAELFQRLREYDYLVVPNLGDEQPRIVYDAYSQGVPVLASDTTGMRQCVKEGETGLFFHKGDASSLVELLGRIDSPAGRAARPAIARRCADVARTMTHAAMHEKRAQLIARLLAA